MDGGKTFMNSLLVEEQYRFHGPAKRLIRFMRLHRRQLGDQRFDVHFMLNHTIGIKFYENGCISCFG